MRHGNVCIQIVLSSHKDNGSQLVESSEGRFVVREAAITSVSKKLTERIAPEVIYKPNRGKLRPELINKRMTRLDTFFLD